jgi:hypothetical protein
VLLLLLVLGVAVGVRWFRLDTPILSSDEAFSWRLAQYPPSVLVRRTAMDVHPPLYYLLLRAWLACWGDSIAASRGLSVVFGVLGVGALYALVVEVCAPRAARVAALFSAALMALHTTQVTPARTARMYALGVFLAALTAWLLLRALRSERQAWLWWAGYALAVAAFCYTHYYAFFTVAAQTCFVAGLLVIRAWKGGFRMVARPATGFCFAGLTALLLYSPWLTVVSAQTSDVGRSYWIPNLRTDEVSRVFLAWGLGQSDAEGLEVGIWLLLAIGIIWLIARGDRAGWFFLVQAAVPWLLAIGWSWGTGRSIFVARYLVFAQVALLGLWGVVLARVGTLPGRVLAGCFLLSVALASLWGSLEQLPERPPAVLSAARFLREHYRSGDVVLVDSAADVNLLRCYAAQVGLRDFDARCRDDPFGRDQHMSHSAALTEREITWPVTTSGEPVEQRIWRASESATGSSPPDGLRRAFSRTFAEGSTRYTLELFERVPGEGGD